MTRQSQAAKGSGHKRWRSPAGSPCRRSKENGHPEEPARGRPSPAQGRGKDKPDSRRAGRQDRAGGFLGCAFVGVLRVDACPEWQASIRGRLGTDTAPGEGLRKPGGAEGKRPRTRQWFLPDPVRGRQNQAWREWGRGLGVMQSGLRRGPGDLGRQHTLTGTPSVFPPTQVLAAVPRKSRTGQTRPEGQGRPAVGDAARTAGRPGRPPQSAAADTRRPKSPKSPKSPRP